MQVAHVVLGYFKHYADFLFFTDVLLGLSKGTGLHLDILSGYVLK